MTFWLAVARSLLTPRSILQTAAEALALALLALALLSHLIFH